MIRFNPTTPVKFYFKESSYVAGQGADASWSLFESDVFHSKTSMFYCEWRSAYGERSMAALSQGVRDSATVRTFYHPELFEKLRGSQAVVIKNGDSKGMVDGEPDRNNPNVYELWSGVENVKEENLFMEFHVRRYEGK